MQRASYISEMISKKKTDTVRNSRDPATPNSMPSRMSNYHTNCSVGDDSKEDTVEQNGEIDDEMETAELSVRPQPKLRFAGVRAPEFLFPKSAYSCSNRPLELSQERTVLKTFLEEPGHLELYDNNRRKRKRKDDEFHSIELHDFSIYRPPCKNTQSGELAPLHFLCARAANNDYCFDGILVDGGKRRYVEKVPFSVVSIGNYANTSLHTVGDQIWIQSARTQGRDVWYQLKAPAPEYQEYHNQFLWLADFAKHFVDYLSAADKVSLNDFRRDFYDWAFELHGNNADFNEWLSKYGSTDFRGVIAAQFEFLWKEASGVDSILQKHAIWSEVDSKRLTAVKEHFFKIEDTVVTPYVHECFKRLPFGKYLNVIDQSSKALASRRRREIEMNLTVDEDENHAAGSDNEATGACSTPAGKNTRASNTGDFTMLREFFDENMKKREEEQAEQQRIQAKAEAAKDRFVGPVIIEPRRLKRDEYGRLRLTKPTLVKEGNVIAVKKDSASVWKQGSDLWFAYVQHVHVTKKGRRLLRVIWLYEPRDTSCSTMYYPIADELFFSDNCNCGDQVLDSDEVLCTVPVALFSKPGESNMEFFVRQKYSTSDASFVTLKKSDLKCAHLTELEKSPLQEAKEKYRVGDTVLALKGTVLEPVQVVEFASDKVLVRRLRRRSRDYKSEKARPNELVWTESIYPVRLDDIYRKCHVRFYTEEEKKDGKIPAPYNRDGTADAFFITCRELRNGPHTKLQPLKKPFLSMNQGFDPDEDPLKSVMSGMDLFCGGGNFGRGLEEGGAVRNKWAVDIGKEQIHTYRANLKDPDDTNLYFGSVNDILRNALKGNFSKHVPEPGEVDFISAGSPCQGFSNANHRRDEEKGLRNSSLVASVAAFVDYYKPKYALLENVAGMASKNNGNVFSQLLCALVGMGYQVQQFHLDAWSFGSPQSRTRIFVSIAAHGLMLPPHPALSHSHPPNKGDKGIGISANGEKYGQRRFEITPFEYVTIGQATKDLPHIGQGRSQTCIKYPDHRQSSTKGNLKRVLINCVPVNPRQGSFIKAVNRGLVPKSIVENYAWGNSGFKRNESSRSWSRVDPNGLAPTITTAVQLACSFVGTTLHWDQHRILSVMEARRAQGFPDNEVLIGVAAAQWKIIGNSVARTVALALGMSVREAWLANNNNDDAPSPQFQRVTIGTHAPHKGPGDVAAKDRSNVDNSSALDGPMRITSDPVQRYAHLLEPDTVQKKRKLSVSALNEEDNLPDGPQIAPTLPSVRPEKRRRFEELDTEQFQNSSPGVDREGSARRVTFDFGRNSDKKDDENAQKTRRLTGPARTVLEEGSASNASSPYIIIPDDADELLGQPAKTYVSAIEC